MSFEFTEARGPLQILEAKYAGSVIRRIEAYLRFL